MSRMKGKWAQGIKPRNFAWIIRDQLAICERPGGYGANHRRVRRQEEIIWLREQSFTLRHLADPLAAQPPQLRRARAPVPAPAVRPARRERQGARRAVSRDERPARVRSSSVILHQEEVGDRLAGVVAGYIRWSGMVPEGPEAIAIIEQITERQLGPVGRSLVALSAQLD